MILSKIIKKNIHYLGNFLRLLRIVLLRSAGVEIGERCMISLRAKFDVRRGKIIIGNGCTVTYGVVILSHDASACRIDSSDGGSGRVILKDNAFIGVNSVILRNVTIGENSIIGAGSVVTRDIPPNVVAVGNPARVIKSLNLCR